MPFTSWPTIWQLKRYRVAKYKQRRQILARPHNAALPNIGKGACAGLSFWWVQRHRFVRESPANRIASLNSNEAFRNHNYLASVFNDRGLGRTPYWQRVALMAPSSLGINANSISHEREKDFETFSRLIRYLDAHPGHHLLGFLMFDSVSREARGHSCALWSGATHMRFFEPNSGEYKVNTGNRVAFFRQLVRQYRTYISERGVRSERRFKAWYICHVG